MEVIGLDTSDREQLNHKKTKQLGKGLQLIA